MQMSPPSGVPIAPSFVFIGVMVVVVVVVRLWIDREGDLVGFDQSRTIVS